MDFSDLLQRTNLNSIETILMHGGENFEKPPDKTYSERLADANKKARAFFKARYTDIEEYDEIAGYFDEQAAVFEDVYFEIGLLIGAKIAYQIRGKMEELS